MRLLQIALLAAYESSLKRPIAVLAATACLLALAAAGVSRLQTVLKIEDVLDRDSPQARLIHSINADFKVGNTSVLLIAPPVGRPTFTPDELCQARRWLSEWRIYAPSLVRSISTFDLRKPVRDGARLSYPPILKLDCDGSDAPAKIAAAYEELRLSPHGGIFTPSVPGQQDLLIELDFENAPETSKLGTYDPNQIRELRETLKTGLLERFPALRLQWLGEADYQHYMLEGIGQVGLLNLLLIAFLVIALRAVLGTWRSGACFVVTLIVTAVPLYGAMGWFGAPMDVLTNSLFLMVAVAALEDFVFVAHFMLVQPEQGWDAAFRRFIVPGFLTSLTTVFGFLSLCWVREQVIPRFGFWAGVGATLEFAVMFLVLPPALKLLPKAARLCDPQRRWIPPARASRQNAPQETGLGTAGHPAARGRG